MPSSWQHIETLNMTAFGRYQVVVVNCVGGGKSLIINKLQDKPLKKTGITSAQARFLSFFSSPRPHAVRASHNQFRSNGTKQLKT